MRPNYYHFRAVDEDGSAQEWLVDDYEELTHEIHLFRKKVRVEVLDIDSWAFIERGEWENVH
jgi:hypothetical protein